MSTVLAYELRPFNSPYDNRTAAWLPCHRCQTVGKVHIMSMGNNPNAIENKFKQLGWQADVHKRSKCFCPTCTAKKIKEDRLLARDVVPAGGRTLKDAPQPVATVTVKPEVLDMLAPKAFPRGGEGSSLKTLTPEQKTALRNELGGTFDENTGCYLDGNSDHLVSEKLNIARHAVIEFREMFYGPLKEDPEVATFRKELAEAKRLVALSQHSISKLEDKIESISRKVGI